jgi:hypothetical protein
MYTTVTFVVAYKDVLIKIFSKNLQAKNCYEQEVTHTGVVLLCGCVQVIRFNAEVGLIPDYPGGQDCHIFIFLRASKLAFQVVLKTPPKLMSSLGLN